MADAPATNMPDDLAIPPQVSPVQSEPVEPEKALSDSKQVSVKIRQNCSLFVDSVRRVAGEVIKVSEAEAKRLEAVVEKP